jgi:hypothetical protein
MDVYGLIQNFLKNKEIKRRSYLDKTTFDESFTLIKKMFILFTFDHIATLNLFIFQDIYDTNCSMLQFRKNNLWSSKEYSFRKQEISEHTYINHFVSNFVDFIGSGLNDAFVFW